MRCQYTGKIDENINYLAQFTANSSGFFNLENLELTVLFDLAVLVCTISS